jgi:hypothetical protein
MGFFQRLDGVINSFFQIGGPNGVGWSDVGATAVEAKDPTNTTFVVVRGATPAAGATNDLTTKAYTDTIFKPIHPSLQFDGNNALPANSVTEKFYVVTTTGANATIGQILWDNGSGVGTVTVLPAVDGNEIVTTAAFAGGTIALAGNSNFVWNATSVSWVNVAAASASPGAVQTIDFAITTAAAQNSVTSLPAGSIVLDCMVTITTPYSPGATIQVGQVGNAGLFQTTAQNVPQTNGNYDVRQRTPPASATAVSVAVGGAPGAGAGFVTLQYTVANP